MRGSKMNTSRSLLIILFQFTPLHERQRSVWTETLLEGEFQFTPLHERQRTYQCTHIWHFLFQFTPLHERQQGCTPVWRIHEHFNSRLYMRGSPVCFTLSLPPFLFQFTPLHERQLQKYTIFSIKSTQFSTKPCFFIVTSRKVVFFSIPVQYFL